MNLEHIENKMREFNSKLYIEKLEYCNEIRLHVEEGFIIVATIINNYIISQLTDNCNKYVDDDFEINLFKKLEDYIYG